MKKQLISQGKPFLFTQENLKKAQELLTHYPEGRQASALIPLLDLAQRQAEGWLPQEALEHVASYLSLPFIQVYEVATFYSMFHLAPVGSYHIQVCTTPPCQLRGAPDVLKACETFVRTRGKKGVFSVCEVECLGACVNAPVVQINDAYYEDLEAEEVSELLLALQEGKPVKADSQEEKEKF